MHRLDLVQITALYVYICSILGFSRNTRWSALKYCCRGKNARSGAQQRSNEDETNTKVRKPSLANGLRRGTSHPLPLAGALERLPVAFVEPPKAHAEASESLAGKAPALQHPSAIASYLSLSSSSPSLSDTLPPSPPSSLHPFQPTPAFGPPAAPIYSTGSSAPLLS